MANGNRARCWTFRGPQQWKRQLLTPDSLEPKMDLFLVFLMGSPMSNDGNPEGVSDRTHISTPDGVLLGMLDPTSMGWMLDLLMASTMEASIADGLEQQMDLFLVFVMGSPMTNERNPYGVSDGAVYGTPDGVTDVGPSEVLNEGSINC